MHARRARAARAPWMDADLPVELVEVVSMLGLRERAMLYGLARDPTAHRGAIVDAGAFFGGSTRALAAGLRDAGRRPGDPWIHTYDWFRVDDFVARHFRGELGSVVPGESFRGVFDRTVGELLERVEVHEGDLLEERWDGGPIAVCFLDVLKSWELNRFGLRLFLPHLLDGAILIQQDYVNPWQPWIAISMEHLAPYFELLGWVHYSSMVYRLRRPIPAQALDLDLGELPAARKEQMLAAAAQRLKGPPRGVLEAARAVLAATHGREAAARRHLLAVAARWGHHDMVARSVAEVLTNLEPQEAAASAATSLA